ILVGAGDAVATWERLLVAVQHRGGLPAGLGARDTLRLEAGLPLHRHDMDATPTPPQAGLSWVVKLGKGAFTGRPVLAAEAAGTLPRKLVGFQLDEAGVPRHGFPVWFGGRAVGSVTSGVKSPTLGTSIGLAYVAPEAAALGTRIAIEIRGRQV